MSEYDNRARLLTQTLYDGPILATIELLGAKCGCPSYAASCKFIRWYRNHPERVQAELAYVAYGPTQHIFGIWYKGMPKHYEYFLDTYARSVINQIDGPRLRQYQRSRAINGRIANPPLSIVNEMVELVDSIVDA